MDIAADSSTLILMSKVTITKHLYEYADKILIPEKVFKEVVTKGRASGKEDALIVENLIKDEKIKIRQIKKREFTREIIRNFNLEEGEAEAITLAIQEQIPLLIDDREGIKTCKIYDIKFITVLSFLTMLRRDQIIDESEGMLKMDRLTKIGYYSKEIIEQAKREAPWKK